MNWLQRLFSTKQTLKEDWRLVKTIAEPVHRELDSSVRGIMYYHLFESNFGNRKCEYANTIDGYTTVELHIYANNFTVYQTKVYRWLKGRFDPEIPTYDCVIEEDLINALKGKI